MFENPDKPTEVIAAAHKRWTRNRDVIGGEDSVKARGEAYLPRLAGQSDEEYRSYLLRTPFFPGAARTAAGFTGLVTRKRGVLTAPTSLEKIFETITTEGHNVDDLAEEIFAETLITAFTGILADQPIASGEWKSQADAEKADGRPFLAIYRAHSILEVTASVIRSRRMLTKVRLLDDADTVRQLELIDGLYTVTMIRRANGQWVADAPFTPLTAGKPLTEIPFVVITPKFRSLDPVEGPLDHIVHLNLHLYREQADAKNSRFYSSAPIPTLKGAKLPDDFIISPGRVVSFPDHSAERPVEFSFTEFSGAGQSALAEAERTLKDDIAKNGSNILASEKSAVEAAETHAIRRSSENSVLAGYARTVSRKIEEALRWISFMTGGPSDDPAVSFSLNTDFVPAAMSAQDRSAALAELMSGAISRETFWAMYVSGEVLPDSFDPELEDQRLAADSAASDRPQTSPEE